jgi:hypothetical protein
MFSPYSETDHQLRLGLRTDEVVRKGKGNMVNHSCAHTLVVRLDPVPTRATKLAPTPNFAQDDILNLNSGIFTAKVERPIEWNVNVLADLLKQIDMNHRGNELEKASPVLINNRY